MASEGKFQIIYNIEGMFEIQVYQSKIFTYIQWDFKQPNVIIDPFCILFVLSQLPIRIIDALFEIYLNKTIEIKVNSKERGIGVNEWEGKKDKSYIYIYIFIYQEKTVFK